MSLFMSCGSVFVFFILDNVQMYSFPPEEKKVLTLIILQRMDSII